MTKMSKAELQIAKQSRKYSEAPLTNLHHYIDVAWMRNSYQSLNRGSSPGVDGLSWSDYGETLSEKLSNLLTGFKSGKYRAPSIRRAYIPKGKNGRRPLGIPTIEDKVLQESVRRVLSPVYEEIFYDFSYGYRPGCSAHQAIDKLFNKVSFNKHYYIIDADIEHYFGSIDHGHLRNFLDLRVKDGVIRKMIDKWLKAGILEGTALHYPTEGTPQGGLISPLLSNIYLHYVLDEWFTAQIQPRLKGESFIIRYADDFVLGFTNKEDVTRVKKVLGKRFNRYNLSLHSEKTRVIDLKVGRGQGARSFDFLGFTHYLGKSRKGLDVLKRKTSGKKFSQSLSKINLWLRGNRFRPYPELITKLNEKLRGHYNYYGITFNSKRIHCYYLLVKRRLIYWLNRRGGKPALKWLRFGKLVDVWWPLLKPKIYHDYLSAKPV